MLVLNSNPILFVEDDHDDHYFFKRICDKLGITNKLLFFDNGLDAIDYLTATSENIFIMLSDINLPFMNGFEFKTKINETPLLQEKCIPFIFFSTAALAPEIRKAYELHAQGFFIKPDSTEGMEENLKCILEYWDRCKRPSPSLSVKDLSQHLKNPG